MTYHREYSKCSHNDSLKMITILKHCTIRFLLSEDVKPTDINRRLKLQYGNVCHSSKRMNATTN